MRADLQRRKASGRSAGYSTGLHSMRTRSPGRLAVWQVILPGRDESVGVGVAWAAAGAGVTTAAGTMAERRAGVAGRVRVDAGCGVWRTAGPGFG